MNTRTPKALTDKQAAALQVIVERTRRNGVSPTIGEIAIALGGMARSTIFERLCAIEKKGWFRPHVPNGTRAYMPGPEALGRFPMKVILPLGRLSADGVRFPNGVARQENF